MRKVSEMHEKAFAFDNESLLMTKELCSVVVLVLVQQPCELFVVVVFEFCS